MRSPPGDPSWMKSSCSSPNGNCVEVVGLHGGHMTVRDSKDKTGPVLPFTPGEWSVFLPGTQNGEFDAIWLPFWLEGTSCGCDCMSG